MRIILEDELCSVESDCDICQSIRGLGVEITDAEFDELYWDCDDGSNEDTKYFSKHLRHYILHARGRQGMNHIDENYGLNSATRGFLILLAIIFLSLLAVIFLVCFVYR